MDDPPSSTLAARVRAFSENIGTSAREGAPTTPPPSPESLEVMHLRREGLLVVDDHRAPGVVRASQESGIRALRRPAPDAIEERLGALQRALEESQRLCAELAAAQHERDVALAVLAHELRGPMSAIAGWARLLRHPRIEPEQRARALEVIEQSALFQQALVDDLMDASRLTTGKLALAQARVDLCSLALLGVDGAMPAAAAAGISLTCQARGQCVVRGDAWRLSQVITNLVTNALKFTAAGGAVAVRVTAGDGVATLRVADTGVGIAPEQLQRIFERFHQAAPASDAGGGLGLGLFLVREIVEMHGGRVVGASPGEGLGATFTVTLPLASEG
ncbi:MAG: HAMP domain-containing sensor histidine kinase [Deltaproteobacteria bacterium]|nr:HAMP domain-containing sensor histidine kinase [Myxococcales bacterium]MDP3215639.1 HAMP domain-containing sensor histidine kinase [Deltaproteobacteria bacterium]